MPHPQLRDGSSHVCFLLLNIHGGEGAIGARGEGGLVEGRDQADFRLADCATGHGRPVRGAGCTGREAGCPQPASLPSKLQFTAPQR